MHRMFGIKRYNMEITNSHNRIQELVYRTEFMGMRGGQGKGTETLMKEGSRHSVGGGGIRTLYPWIPYNSSSFKNKCFIL